MDIDPFSDIIWSVFFHSIVVILLAVSMAEKEHFNWIYSYKFLLHLLDYDKIRLPPEQVVLSYWVKCVQEVSSQRRVC